MQAIETFDPTKGYILRTHAYRRIYGEMQDSFRRGEGDLMKRSRLHKTRVNRWEDARKVLIAELGREPEIDEIEEGAEVTFHDYLQAKDYASRKVVHADHKNGEVNGNDYAVWERLGLTTDHSGFTLLDNKDFLYGLMDRAKLTERERDVIKLTYGLREPTEDEWNKAVAGHNNAAGTYNEYSPVAEYRLFLRQLDIGYVLDVSPSRVGQLEKGAFRKMQIAFEVYRGEETVGRKF